MLSIAEEELEIKKKLITRMEEVDKEVDKQPMGKHLGLLLLYATNKYHCCRC